MIFSRKAKEFVRALLHVDPVKRVSAGEALGLPWMRLAEQRETEALPANFAQEQTSVLRRIADFQSYGVVKRAALTFIAHRMHAGMLYVILLFSFIIIRTSMKSFHMGYNEY